MVDQAAIEQAADYIRNSKKLVIFTGAGASKESGIPTFREAQEGVWEKFDPEDLGTPQGFQKDPQRVWDWFAFRREMATKAQPNAGHIALAEIEKRVPSAVTITQNVDDLHERAGSKNVLHLHGSLFRHKCFDDCQGKPTLVDLDSLEDKDASPPKCPHCAAYVRPDVVWFREMLPEDILQAAYDWSDTCDLMMVVGTTGLVTPAARLPYMAKQSGAKIIEVNPAYSMITRYADIKLEAGAGEVLPLIVEAIEK